ncbi:MAG: hypothetical protein PWR12_1626 [Eubacteriaceae bacterium]|jgi:uncharacterized phage protein (predicted DNA packaging)|nr:hypothetical protein [Eubacteriaceae bacterium]
MDLASGKITLGEVKEYLRVDFDDDDTFISDLIDLSDFYIDKSVGSAYKNYPEYEKAGILVQKKIIQDMYDERSTTVADRTKQSTIVMTIFEHLESAQWEET